MEEGNRLNPSSVTRVNFKEVINSDASTQARTVKVSHADSEVEKAEHGDEWREGGREEKQRI